MLPDAWHAGHSVCMVTARLVADAIDVRRFLLGCLDRPTDSLPTYKEVGAVCGRVPPGLGQLLDFIYDDCRAHGEPDLTALVVNQRTRLPGKFGGRYAVDEQMDSRAWWDELRRVRSYSWPRDTAAAPSA